MTLVTWWLFVNGSESIRIEVMEPLALVIKGAGHRRVERRFASERELTEFAVVLESELFAAGWRLVGFEVDRRRGQERRGVARAAPDRRWP